MIVSIIVARARNGAIGKDNQLLWHFPEDMKFFKETTSGHCIITGRKNYESIPPKFRPLKNRTNIIVTRNEQYQAEGAEVVHSLQAAINIARDQNESEAFVIGGGEIYRQSLELGLVDKMYITEVDADFEADTFFPELDGSEWDVGKVKSFPSNEKTKLSAELVIYSKKDS